MFLFLGRLNNVLSRIKAAARASEAPTPRIVTASDLSLDLGTAPPHTFITKTLTLPIEKGKTTRIVQVGRTCGCITPDIAPVLASPGTGHTLHLRYSTPSMPKDARQQINILVRDEETGIVDRLIINARLRVRDPLTLEPVVNETILESFGDIAVAKMRLVPYFEANIDGMHCSTNVHWLRVRGELPSPDSTHSEITVAADPKNLSVGRHFGRLTISTKDNQTQRIVVLQINPPFRIVPAVGLLRLEQTKEGQGDSQWTSLHKLFHHQLHAGASIGPEDFEIDVSHPGFVTGNVEARSRQFFLKVQVISMDASIREGWLRIKNKRVSDQWVELPFFFSAELDRFREPATPEHVDSV